MSEKFKKINKIDYSPYVPNYKKMGIEPTYQISSKAQDFYAPHNQSLSNKHYLDNDNPRIRKPDIAVSKNVPYAEVSEMAPVHSVPNIGNNIEHAWVGVDGHIIDDAELNEDYAVVSEDEIQTVSEEKNNKNSTNIGEYVLIFNGEIVSTGSLDMVEKDVKSLVFGEHELCNNFNITVEDLIVLKRVSIKVGVFIE